MAARACRSGTRRTVDLPGVAPSSILGDTLLERHLSALESRTEGVATASGKRQQSQHGPRCCRGEGLCLRLFRGARISRQALRLRWAGIVGRGSPALPLAFVPAARGFTCGQRQSDVRRAATNIGPHQQLTLGRRVNTVVQTVPAAQKVHEGLPIPLPRPRPTRFFCKAQRGRAR